MLIDLSEARGKKKKKRAGGSSGPTCESAGLDCSKTCCTGAECAEVKLDCAKEFRRPFQELYIGLGTVFGITMGASVVIGIMNFCLMFKFCQHYDENLDTYVGGFSVCDAISCLLTCGVIYRKKEALEGSGNEQDFRKRFEKSMDKARGEGAFAEKKKRERKSKNVANYLS